MLQKSKSKKVFQLKYLLLIPLLCMMLAYTSCSDDTQVQSSTISKTSKTIGSDDIMHNITVLKESIAAKGEMTEEEEKALKGLLLLTTENGFSEPFFSDVANQAEIPFGVIDQVPIYPGCENQSKEDSKNCFSKKIQQFVVSNFNTKLGDHLNLTGMQKIYVRFKIDHTGNIADVQARSSVPELEDEAKRVINSLPKMKPGSQEGVNVNVMYSLPIKFDIK